MPEKAMLVASPQALQGDSVCETQYSKKRSRLRNEVLVAKPETLPGEQQLPRLQASFSGTLATETQVKP